MKVTELDERVIQDIGHAFGYYDYGPEHGLIDAFPGRDAAAAFIWPISGPAKSSACAPCCRLQRGCSAP